MINIVPALIITGVLTVVAVVAVVILARRDQHLASATVDYGLGVLSADSEAPYGGRHRDQTRPIERSRDERSTQVLSADSRRDVP